MDSMKEKRPAMAADGSRLSAESSAARPPGPPGEQGAGHGRRNAAAVSAQSGTKTPAALPDDEVLYELADLFRVFGDSTRIKILYALHDTELCVQEIADTLGISQSAVSHQLRVLKDSKLVRFRRDGKTVYYALDDDHVRSLLNIGMEHIEE